MINEPGTLITYGNVGGDVDKNAVVYRINNFSARSLLEAF